MAIKLRKSYKFALRSSLVITLLTTILFVVFHMDLGHMDWTYTLLFALISFSICFTVIQVRVERFIYRRIKKIYDDVSLLESSTFSSKPVTTDMKTLTEEIEKFAEGKKIEIDTLKIREEYRKDFLGNVSHELKTPLFTVQGYILTLLDGAMKDKKLREKYKLKALEPNFDL